MKIFSRLAVPLLTLALCAAPAVKAQDIKEGMPEEKAAPAQENAQENSQENPAGIPPMPERRDAPPDIPMAAFGTAHPECLVWNDNCQTCARDDQEHIFCSTPGIACLPGEIACTKNR